jgi:hypothetical protein
MEASALHDRTARRSTSPLAALRGREAGYQGRRALARLAWAYDTPLKRDRS